jgi:periplasmic protein TonB
MSVAEGTPPSLLPADPDFRESRERDARGGRLRRTAIIAAALAHMAVIAAVIIRWPPLFPAVPQERPPIAVTLVQAPPPPPPAPAKPAAAPPSLGHELVSGPDTKTTAPPKAAEKGPEAAPKPTPPPPIDTPAKTATAEPKPVPKPESHSPKPKLANRETTPNENRGSVNRAPGQDVRDGDPYLNELFGLIERHRAYPANAIGPLGLRLEGTTVYLIAVRSDGALVGTHLERSSGADVLDEAALKMIEAAAPFPPTPSYYPRPGVVLEVTIHLYPGAG